MKIRHSQSATRRGVPQLTAMIDVVFLLLVFFLLTFRISAVEGDFHVKMPSTSAEPSNDGLLRLQLRLTADAGGRLAGIDLDGRRYASLDELQDRIVELIGEERGPNSMQAIIVLELKCDEGLSYRDLIDAITTVSGYIDDNGDVIHLVRRIRFAP